VFAIYFSRVNQKVDAHCRFILDLKPFPSNKPRSLSTYSCTLIKKNVGFTGDGDISEYPYTLNRVLKKFPDAKIVIPGHGKHGGIEIIHHNIKLASNPRDNK
jgi:hypothetical protein